MASLALRKVPISTSFISSLTAWLLTVKPLAEILLAVVAVKGIAGLVYVNGIYLIEAQWPHNAGISALLVRTNGLGASTFAFTESFFAITGGGGRVTGCLTGCCAGAG